LTVARTVLTCYSYRPREILWCQLFVDILERVPDGTLSVDYTHFDDVIPSNANLSTEPSTGGVPPE
jgi:hypothetical protein